MRSTVPFWGVCALAVWGSAVPAAAQSPVIAGADGMAAETPSDASLTPDASGADPANGDSVPWGLRHRRYNTVDGATGGLFLSDPSSGAPGSVRLQLAFDVFSGSDFLRTGDEIAQSGQTLSVSWTAVRSFEVYASMRARGTSSEQPVSEEIHLLGDTTFGFKAFAPVGSFIHLGGDLWFALMNDMGGAGLLLEATQIGARGDLAFDLRDLDDPVPFVGRVELAYLFDNSAKIADAEEDARHAALANPMTPAKEVRHLVNRFERFGLGINRVDQLHIGLGAEAPFAVTDDLYLAPLVEWRLGIPINRQGYDCTFYASDSSAGTRDGGDDTCVDQAGLSSWPMNLALGARVVPPVRGVSLMLAVDFGFTGADDFVRELAPNPPFVAFVALGYDYDARPAPGPAAAPPPPATGRVRGLVVAQGTGVPVPGATVRFVGQGLDPQLADAAGRFTSPAFDPGEIPLEVTHPEYGPAPCTATIPASGGDVDARCVLAPLPPFGRIEGRVVDLFGGPVAGARVQFVGSAAPELTSDATGAFARGDLAPGVYTLRIESSAHLVRVVRVDVVERHTAHAFATLLARPRTPGVEVKGGQVRASGLVFQGDATDLSPTAALAVAELADLLLRDPSLVFVRIQGDGSGGRALARAVTVKQRLVDAGVSDARLDASTEPAKRLTITIVK